MGIHKKHRLAKTLINAALLLPFLCGCDRTYGQQACRMENECVLAESKGIPTSVAVKASDGEGFQVAWASDDATWVSNLGPSGNLLGKPVKIGRQNINSTTVMPKKGETKTFWPNEDRLSIKAENLDLVRLVNGRRILLILERPDSKRGGGVFAASYDASSKEEPKVVQLGSAGEYSGRVAAAAHGNKVIVAWHDGRLDASDIRITYLKQNALEADSIINLESDNPAYSPSLAVSGDSVFLAWAEIIEENATQKSIINVAKVTENLEIKDKVTVHKGLFVDNEPELAVAGDRLGLVFRDDKDKDETLEYHFALLKDSGELEGAPKRISQADGWRGPRLAYLDSRFVATTIRSFQRNLLIGLNQFDLKGAKLSGEFQVYADKTDFVRVDLDAKGDNIIMIYAEDRRDTGRILSARVTCQKEV